jgi:hypothetical protein
MCVMRLRIRREKSGLLRDRMALERSALACPLIAPLTYPMLAFSGLPQR